MPLLTFKCAIASVGVYKYLALLENFSPLFKTAHYQLTHVLERFGEDGLADRRTGLAWFGGTGDGIGEASGLASET